MVRESGDLRAGAPGSATTLGIAQIKRLLPHRYPMLLVDRVLEVTPGEHVRGLKAVSCDEPWYEGMSDDAPPRAYAYPQVLLVESWCQCGALMAAGDRSAGCVALLGGVSGASFDRDVYPGDLLEHHVRVARRFADTWILTGESTVGGARVLRIEEAVLALRPAEVLRSGDAPDPAGPPAGAAEPAMTRPVGRGGSREAESW
jgi:3-hydroxyacyl-[acyl-carrier-protein] dehydratase